MADTYNKWRVHCTTDNVDRYWVLDENTTAPTTCPDNSGHSIDSTLTAVVSTVGGNNVNIIVEDIQTGGHFQASARCIDISATGEPQIFDFVLPMQISVAKVYFTSEETHRGDDLEIMVNPDFDGLGSFVTTGSVATGDSVLNVSSYLLGYVKIGYYITIDDGVNSNDLGRITAIDTGAGTITTNYVTTNSFAPGTSLKVNIKFVDEQYCIGPPMLHAFGDSDFKTSSIPSGTIFRAVYTNNSGVAKKVTLFSHYYY